MGAALLPHTEAIGRSKNERLDLPLEALAVTLAR